MTCPSLAGVGAELLDFLVILRCQGGSALAAAAASFSAVAPASALDFTGGTGAESFASGGTGACGATESFPPLFAVTPSGLFPPIGLAAAVRSFAAGGFAAPLVTSEPPPSSLKGGFCGTSAEGGLGGGGGTTVPPAAAGIAGAGNAFGGVTPQSVTVT